MQSGERLSTSSLSYRLVGGTSHSALPCFSYRNQSQLEIKKKKKKQPKLVRRNLELKQEPGPQEIGSERSETSGLRLRELGQSVVYTTK